MARIFSDVHLAVRKLAKNPGFSAVAILTLAFGIGPTAVLFGAMGGILLRPLPFRQPHEVVWIWEVTPQGRQSTTSAATFLDWRRECRSFSEMAAYDFLGFDLGGLERPESVVGAAVSANLFSVLGVRPEIGRSFLPEEEQLGSSGVVVLSHRLWQRKFAGRRDVIGHSLILNDRPYKVIGVLPQDFWLFLDTLDIFIPLSWDPAVLADRSNRGYDVIARPRNGVPLGQAQAEMDRIAGRLAAAYPAVSAGWGARLQPVQAHYLGYFRPAMRVMLLIVGVVLLITCANVANVLLAQGLGRQREFAIRLAVGAKPAALRRLVLVESLLLAFTGALLSVGLAAWTRSGMLAILPGELQRRLPGGVAAIGVDGTLLVLMLGVAAGTGLLMGWLPAWQAASRCDPGEALKRAGTGVVAGKDPMRNALVACQVGFAAVTLVVGAFLVKSYRETIRADLGFHSERVLRVGFSLSQLRYPTEAHRAALYTRVLERARAIPGVESAALVNSLLPPPNALGGPFLIEGRALVAASDSATANVRLVSANYFRHLGIPLLQGRSFSESDVRGAPQTVILSRFVAQKYWPDGDAVGRRIRLGTPATESEWLTVVGVVGDVRHPLADTGARIIYRPLMQAPTSFASLLVRAPGNPEALRAAIEKAAWSLDPQLALWGTAPLADVVAEESSHLRFTTIVLNVFAALAVGLAVFGVFGCNAYAVRRRSREIAVRVALGADPKDIRRLIIGQAMTPVLWGAACGLAGAAALLRAPLLAEQLHRVSPNGWALYAVSAILLTSAALAGCLTPARRAAKVDPMVALRHE